MAHLYIWREENNNNNSHPNLNISIVVPLIWNKTSSSAPTNYFSSPTRNWSTSFFFSSLSGIPRQRTESYSSKYSSKGQLGCCNVLQHISQAFSTVYFPWSRKLRYNLITWLERNISSWTYFTAPVQLLINANGGKNGGKFRRLKKIIKKLLFVGIKKFLRERHSLMCKFGWENKKFRYRQI